MSLRLGSPWARAGVAPEDAERIEALAADVDVSVLARSPGGPYTAKRLDGSGATETRATVEAAVGAVLAEIPRCWLCGRAVGPFWPSIRVQFEWGIEDVCDPCMEKVD